MYLLDFLNLLLKLVLYISVILSVCLTLPCVVTVVFVAGLVCRVPMDQGCTYHWAVFVSSISLFLNILHFFKIVLTTLTSCKLYRHSKPYNFLYGFMTLIPHKPRRSCCYHLNRKNDLLCKMKVLGDKVSFSGWVLPPARQPCRYVWPACIQL